MQTDKRSRLRVLTIVPMLVVGGCSPLIFESTITVLRDSASGLATEAIDAFFQTGFGLPTGDAAGDAGLQEVNGNDTFIHM